MRLRLRRWFGIPEITVATAFVAAILVCLAVAKCCGPRSAFADDCADGKCVAPMRTASFVEPIVVPVVALNVVRWDGTDFGGLTYYKPPRIELLASMDQALDGARGVCAHELGHLLTGPEHSKKPDSWMQSRAPAIHWPSAEDIDAARASLLLTPRSYRLTLPPDFPPSLERALRWAAATWNSALDRNVFVVEPAR